MISCFDYPNALADLVVGYMGVPYYKVDMTAHPQYITVRNDRGTELLDSVRGRLEVCDNESSLENVACFTLPRMHYSVQSRCAVSSTQPFRCVLW